MAKSSPGIPPGTYGMERFEWLEKYLPNKNKWVVGVLNVFYFHRENRGRFPF